MAEEVSVILSAVDDRAGALFKNTPGKLRVITEAYMKR